MHRGPGARHDVPKAGHGARYPGGRGAGAGGGGQDWMISFSDLLSLVLTFFVLLFAMKEVEVNSWQPFVEGVRKQMRTPLSPRERGEAEGARQSAEPLLPVVPEGVDLDYVEALFRELDMSGRNGDAVFQVRRLYDRLVISVPADRLLAGDGTALLAGADALLGRLADRLRFVPNRVLVAVHDERADVAGERHPSKWEWTVDRAMAVADGLRRAGFPGALSAVGFGDARNGGSGASSDAVASAGASRLASRRVDIIVMRFERSRNDALSF
nr:flagellar motor protein MotB [Rhodothalassium salexigens]